MNVNPVLLAHPEQLAAAAKPTPPAITPPPGDASNAVLLAALKDTKLTIGTQTGVSMQVPENQIL